MNLDAMVLSELEELANAAADGVLNEGQRERLEGILAGSDDARRFYVRFMTLSAGLALAAQDAGAVASVSGERHVFQIRRWAIAAAACLAIAIAGLWGKTLLAPRTAPVQQPAGIAVLSNAVNVEWESTQEPLHVNNVLPPGRLRLKSGVLDIDFIDGAHVTVLGPADFTLKSAREGYCGKGRVLVDVPEAHGFRLGTPMLQSVGVDSAPVGAARFGVDLSGPNACIHDFLGDVQVHLSDSDTEDLRAGDVYYGRDGHVEHGEADAAVFDPTAVRGFGPHGHGPGGPGGPGDMGPHGWKGADPMEEIHHRLQIDDAKWTLLSAKLRDLLEIQKGMMADYLGRMDELRLLNTDPNTTDDDVGRRLESLRASHAEWQQELEAAQEEVRKLLDPNDPREEAVLVTMGILK